MISILSSRLFTSSAVRLLQSYSAPILTSALLSSISPHVRVRVPVATFTSPVVRSSFTSTATPKRKMTLQKLTAQEQAEALTQLQDWSLVDGREAIKRTLIFKDFNAAFGFMTRVALYADKHDHHPEWFNVRILQRCFC